MGVINKIRLWWYLRKANNVIKVAVATFVGLYVYDNIINSPMYDLYIGNGVRVFLNYSFEIDYTTGNF